MPSLFVNLRTSKSNGRVFSKFFTVPSKGSKKFYQFRHKTTGFEAAFCKTRNNGPRLFVTLVIISARLAYLLNHYQYPTPQMSVAHDMSGGISR
jgi:hypothetical protein